MYFHGRYYQTDSVSEAMTMEALTNHHAPRSRGQAIVSAIVRHLLLTPAYLVVAVMVGILGEYAVHLITG